MKILDTTVSEIGTENVSRQTLIDSDSAVRVHCYLGVGDTIIIEGKINVADAYQTLYTFDDANLEPIDIYFSPYFRARRAVDGGGESVVKIAGSTAYGVKL